MAFEDVKKLIVKAGVVVDAIDVGGGFPSRYTDSVPARLSDFVEVIKASMAKLPVTEQCRLICEPGRALVAEAESLIVKVDLRKGDELYINDGGYGALFDSAQLGFVFPVRLLRDGPRSQRAACAVRVLGADVRFDRSHEGAVPAAGVACARATTSRSATSAPMAGRSRPASTATAPITTSSSRTSQCTRSIWKRRRRSPPQGAELCSHLKERHSREGGRPSKRLHVVLQAAG